MPAVVQCPLVQRWEEIMVRRVAWAALWVVSLVVGVLVLTPAPYSGQVWCEGGGLPLPRGEARPSIPF